MSAILLGLGSALFIGFADLFGSLGGRRGRVLAVTLWVFLVGTIAVAVAAAIIGGSPRPVDLALGAGAGLAGGLGLLTLYAGYAKTTIGIVGPIAAVLGAALPVAVGMIDAPPSVTALVGIVVGLGAIALIGISREGSDPVADARQAVLYGVGAGVAFGFMATIIGFTGTDAGMWPIIPMRLASALTLTVLALATNQRLIPIRASWRFIPAAATLSALGIGMFALSAQRDLVIGGLLLQMAYAVTAILAIVFLGERATRTQLVGFAGALVSLVLLTTA